MEFENANWLLVPFGLEQVGFMPKLETAIDLFANQREGRAGAEVEGVEQALEIFLERIAARTSFHVPQRVQFVP